ncbi:MAG: hypothetical protein RXQ70_05245 [Sulfolobaceae archaeon]|nr:hypothetical protein [Sulfolobales archaeon]
MTWCWRDCRNGRKIEPWAIKLADSGVEVSQIEVADRIERLLEERRPVIFRSAPGTGKTLPAIEAMVRVVRNDLMNGKPILYLVPTKSLQKDLVRRLTTEICYFIDSDQKLEVYDILGRKEIPCPWWRAHMDLSATATRCARSSCPLYFPITTKGYDMDGLRLVAKWGQRRLYGLENLSVATSDPSIIDVLKKSLRMVNGAYVCPYLGQYVAFDENLGPRIIITNYFKFIADVTTGKYDIDSFAGIIIDEAELFFDTFRPKDVDYTDLVYVRQEIREKLKAVERGEVQLSREGIIRKTLGITLEVVDEILARVRERLDGPGSDGFMRLERYVTELFLELVRLGAELEDVFPDVAELIQATIPLDPKQRHADIDLFLSTRGTKAFTFVFIPRRLRLLEELMQKPLVLLMGTPDHVIPKILNVDLSKFGLIEGQDIPPGKFVIIPFEGAQSLKGIGSKHDKHKSVIFPELCHDAFKLLEELRGLLGGVAVLGFAISKKYVEWCENATTIDAYFDTGRYPIDDLTTAIENGKILLSTRLWRGINPMGSRVVIFIPKFPRPELDPALTVTFKEMRSRGIQFTGFILNRISRTGSIDSEYDLSNEIGFRNLYQAVARGNRGHNYISFLISIDVETYAAAAKLVRGGLLPWPYVLMVDKVSEPRIVRATEAEVERLAVAFDAQNAVMNQVYKDIVNTWRKRAEDEGIPLGNFLSA